MSSGSAISSITMQQLRAARSHGPARPRPTVLDGCAHARRLTEIEHAEDLSAAQHGHAQQRLGIVAVRAEIRIAAEGAEGRIRLALRVSEQQRLDRIQHVGEDRLRQRSRHGPRTSCRFH